MGGMDAPTVATGFAALDAELPGGGWPTHSLSELLLAQAGQCEWRLLGPALPAVVQGGGRIYLIAPPKQPHAGGLAQLEVLLKGMFEKRRFLDLLRRCEARSLFARAPQRAVLPRVSRSVSCQAQSSMLR